MQERANLQNSGPKLFAYIQYRSSGITYHAETLMQGWLVIITWLHWSLWISMWGCYTSFSIFYNYSFSISCNEEKVLCRSWIDGNNTGQGCACGVPNLPSSATYL